MTKNVAFQNNWALSYFQQFQGSWRVFNYALNNNPDKAQENGNETRLESGKAEKMTSLDTIRFKKLAPDVNYLITILTQINGTVIARATSKAVKF